MAEALKPIQQLKAHDKNYERAVYQYSNCIHSQLMCSQMEPQNVWEIVIYGPAAQSRDQDPFKNIYSRSTHNVSLAGFKTQSHIV